MLKNLFFIAYSDSPTNFSFGFQDPATQWMLGIMELHDGIVIYLIVIVTIVIWFLYSACYNRDHLANLHHGNSIEVIWTMTPAKMLWVIGVPSLKLLYIKDELLSPEISIKAIGNQWYWTYEYTDYESANGIFDSFMVADDDLELGELRELTVDNYLV
jgi:cytochrome c oxidase subunit 2